jgi:hypothetical protein
VLREQSREDAKDKIYPQSHLFGVLKGKIFFFSRRTLARLSNFDTDGKFFCRIAFWDQSNSRYAWDMFGAGLFGVKLFCPVRGIGFKPLCGHQSSYAC